MKPSTYVAIVEESPFLNAGGFTLNETKGEHAVVGVLPRDEEDWR